MSNLDTTGTYYEGMADFEPTQEDLAAYQDCQTPTPAPFCVYSAEFISTGNPELDRVMKFYRSMRTTTRTFPTVAAAVKESDRLALLNYNSGFRVPENY